MADSNAKGSAAKGTSATTKRSSAAKSRAKPASATTSRAASGSGGTKPVRVLEGAREVLVERPREGAAGERARQAEVRERARERQRRIEPFLGARARERQ